ncbi:hypothetical protein SCHPADRAFT_943486 [Schizopora paradoxa]|uniref:BTB domain-containing protein n=1 Tax=Schizopora paradoxa TaxID=27342 RepID=A0A0H2RXW2_9AGAM|nr:hypothetical protein SCHPADRAFT_943486 [Schizopora paradoxa]
MADFVRDDEFYMTLVQNVHFRVPVEAFEDRSEIFRDMFALPNDSEEGRSDDMPIVLEGIEVDDFKALLRFLYPKERASAVRLSQKEWMGIHTLAHMWGFEEARKASKAFLIDMEDSIAKIEIASRYDYDDWLRKAYEELSKRPDPLSIEEVHRIGVHVEAAFHIAQIREDRLKALSCLRVLHPDVKMFGKHKGETYCPQCSAAIKVYWLSDEDGSTCRPCGLTFYREKEPINRSIDRRIRDKIRALLPDKSAEVSKLVKDDEEDLKDIGDDGLMPVAAISPAAPMGAGALDWRTVYLDSDLTMAMATRDGEFYMNLVTFRVEDVLFKVPVDRLNARSEIFRKKYCESSPPTDDVGAADLSTDSSDASPIILKDVKSAHFKALLKYLYPNSDQDASPKFSKEEWIGIHALAHAWGIEELLQTSKTFLFNMGDSIRKFEIGRDYHYTDWQRKAYLELAVRRASLTVNEAKRIGLRATIEINSVRDVRLKSMAQIRKYGAKTCCPFCRTPFDSSREPERQCQPCDITFCKDGENINKLLPLRLKDMISTFFETPGM